MLALLNTGNGAFCGRGAGGADGAAGQNQLLSVSVDYVWRIGDGSLGHTSTHKERRRKENYTVAQRDFDRVGFRELNQKREEKLKAKKSAYVKQNRRAQGAN